MILFIEDQVETADLYLDEMRDRGLDVQYFKDVDTAWAYLEAEEYMPRVAVLDVMMPHGKLFTTVATSDGLITGLRLYEKFRSRFPECFILALTNLTSPVVEETLKGDERAFLRRKDEFYYDEIADEVEALYKKAS